MDHSDTSDSITASTPTPTSAQAIAGPSKRARQSTGGGSTAEVRSANIVAQFDDFRRRAIKQNKEIVQANVNHKLAVKTMQDEIITLKAEILKVRQEKARVEQELRAEQVGLGLGSVGKPRDIHNARTAVDTIISMMPSLQILQESLRVDSQSQAAPNRYAVNAAANADPFTAPSNALRGTTFAMPEVFVSRPAEAYREGVKLGVLQEEPSDDEGEDERGEWGAALGSVEAIDYRSRRKSGQASRSNRPPASPAARGTVSATADNSPPTPTFTKALPIPPSPSPTRPTPPRSSPKASPAKRRERRKGRRESGLITPITPVEDVVPPVPEDQVVMDDEDAVLDLVSMPSEAIEVVSLSREEERSDKASSRSGSAVQSEQSMNVQNPGTAGAGGESQEEHGGRARRARGSVSYKEPSLNKKMRKPDGVTVDEAMRGARSSLLGSSTSGTPAPDEDGSSASTTSTSSGRSRKPKVPNTSLRRKSALPKAGRSGGVSVLEGMEEEAMDDLPEIDIRSESPPSARSIASAASSALTELSDLTELPGSDGDGILGSSRGTVDSMYSSSSGSTESAVTESDPSDLSYRASESARGAGRVSPRKTIAQRQGQLGSGRPGGAVGANGGVVAQQTRRVTPVGGRGVGAGAGASAKALVDRQENGQVGVGVGASARRAVGLGGGVNVGVGVGKGGSRAVGGTAAASGLVSGSGAGTGRR